MAAWGNKGAVSHPAPPVSFKTIVEQQSSVNDVDLDDVDNIMGGSVGIDSSLDINSFLTTECNDDLKLAQLLQQLEDEDSAASYEALISEGNKKHRDQNMYSKISVVSRYDSSTTNQRRVYQGSNIRSSDYDDAMHRESQLTSVGVSSGSSSMFKGGVTMLPDGNFVSKHDSLLNSLSNSVKLSEIDGVGDLSGAGLLIGNSVANSIRSSAQKKRNK